jgi:L-cysteine desulfidase
MYLSDDNFKAGHGIMGEDVEHTVRNVGVLASQGMRETDRVILKIMTE